MKQPDRTWTDTEGFGHCQKKDGCGVVHHLGFLWCRAQCNIFVAPAHLAHNNQMVVDVQTELLAILIDFGQAVDVQHPEVEALLRRELVHVHAFFTRVVAPECSSESGSRDL